jgi:predicted RNA-binding Zn-ribbon protein involved in translation (DUF1610 family)
MALQQGATAEHMLLAAAMQLAGVYQDETTQPLRDFFAAGAAGAAGAEMNLSTLPDMCHMVHEIPFWGKISKDSAENQVWLSLLGQCLPNPCRARAFEQDLKDHLNMPFTHTAMRDFLLRVIFGALLDVYHDSSGGSGDPNRSQASSGTKEKAMGVREKMVLYAAFSLCPPTTQELMDFVSDATAFVLFAVRRFIFHTVSLVPAVHDYLCRSYYWEDMLELTVGGLRGVRETLVKKGLAPGFLSNAALWVDINATLNACNHQTLKLCYRAADRPFYQKVVAEYERIARAHNSRLPSPTGAQFYEAYAHVAQFQAKEHLTKELLDSLPIENEMLATIRYNYEMEIQPTGLSKFLPTLFDTDLYGQLYALFKAVQHRLSFRWARLPRSWAQSQLEALGSLEAGLHFVCPKCQEIRANVLTYPEGKDERRREKSLYPVDLTVKTGGEDVLMCRAKRIRKHDATAKRYQQNRRENNQRQRIDPIDVCSDVQVLRVNMIGVLLFVGGDWVVLCVDCGAMVRWHPDAVTDRGPICGCQLKPKIPQCALCKKRTKHIRVHAVLKRTGVEEVVVCASHNTEWVDALEIVPVYKEFKQAVLKRQHRIRVGQGVVFVDRKKA